MIISTLPTYPGKRIVKDLGIIYAYDDALRPVRMNYNIEKAFVNAEKCLIEKAQELGANAILGLSFSLKIDVPILLATAVVLEDE